MAILHASQDLQGAVPSVETSRRDVSTAPVTQDPDGATLRRTVA